jgi:hypothetical protein
LGLFSFAFDGIEAATSGGGDFVGAGARVFVVDSFSKRPCEDHVLSAVSKAKSFFKFSVLVKWGFGPVGSGGRGFRHAEIKR